MEKEGAQLLMKNDYVNYVLTCMERKEKAERKGGLSVSVNILPHL